MSNENAYLVVSFTRGVIGKGNRAIWNFHDCMNQKNGFAMNIENPVQTQ